MSFIQCSSFTWLTSWTNLPHLLADKYNPHFNKEVTVAPGDSEPITGPEFLLTIIEEFKKDVGKIEDEKLREDLLNTMAIIKQRAT